MHEIVGRMSVRHHGAQAARAVDHVDGRGMADRIAAVGVRDLVEEMPKLFCAASISARVPTPPMNVGSKVARYFFICAALSRSGSTVTYTTCTSRGRAPSFLRAPASVASVIGHTSPQLLKPNASSTTLPRKRARLSGLPSVPCSANPGRRHHAGSARRP